MLSKFFSLVKTLLNRLLSLFKKEGDDVLNKELMLLGNRVSRGTHTITVEAWDYLEAPGDFLETRHQGIGYSAPFLKGKGAMTPNTFAGEEIRCCSYEKSKMTNSTYDPEWNFVFAFGDGCMETQRTIKITNLENGVSVTIGSTYADLTGLGAGAGYYFDACPVNILDGFAGKTIDLDIMFV